MLFAGVKRSGKKGPQTVVRMTPKHVKETKRTSRCVHAVGGGNGTTLTKSRREQVRREHNKEVQRTGNTGSCCRHHVRNWRELVLAK